MAAGGLLVAAGAGALIVRLALRPLDRVAATATRVSELPLDRGAVELSSGCPPPTPTRAPRSARSAPR